VPEPTDVVTAFNERINARDPDGLAALMSDDHTFTDTAGSSVVGKPACVAAWEGFFASFPGYRNVFESVSATGPEVVALGHSVCPGQPALEGPARWTATVADGLVTSWRVEDRPGTPAAAG
jgi:ketosteroid isomerase-like protein